MGRVEESEELFPRRLLEGSQDWTWKWKHKTDRVLAVLHWEVLESHLLENRSHLSSSILSFLRTMRRPQLCPQDSEVFQLPRKNRNMKAVPEPEPEPNPSLRMTTRMLRNRQT